MPNDKCMCDNDLVVPVDACSVVHGGHFNHVRSHDLSHIASSDVA